MSSRTFPAQFLEDQDVFYGPDNMILGTSRWATQMEDVFEFEGKHYLVKWEAPATEYQEWNPFCDEDTVDCVEVVQQEKVIHVWVPA